MRLIMLRCSPHLRTTVGVILALTVVATVAGPRYSSRIVETKSGSIRGIIQELSSKHLEPVEVFRGVPYAAPPVGERRYMPPGPPLPWSGTRVADTFPPVCPQRLPDISNKTLALMSMPRGRYLQLRRLVPLLQNQSEDCLYLNLYVPGSGNRGLEAPYAVIAFVHGESYEWNAGNPYEGSVLTSYGHVIVVTINFRLGVLGFLRTRSEPDKPNMSGGNLGVQDIAAALLWVQNNVAAFGGDPKRVTLMGHDTGAALVNILLLTASAKGLFHRAVLLSGSILSPWATVQQPNNLRNMVAEQLGCKADPEADIAPCLRKKPLSELMNVQFDAPRFLARFGPSSPPDAMTADPEFAMEHASDAFITRELVLGAATTESYLDFNAADIQYGFEEDQRNRVLRTYVRNAYIYHLNEIFSTVRNEYTDWDKPILHPINIRDSTLEALSDGHTVSPLVRVGYLHARRGAKTYFFHFGYQSKETDYPQRLGSVRGEAFTYILGLPLVGGLPYFPQNFTKQDMGVAEAVLNFFTNFAKTGDPNEPRNQVSSDYGTVKEKSRYKSIVWESYETQSQQYLSITLKPKMKSHYRGHKMAIWLNLIPQLHQPGDEDVSMRHHHFHERAEHYYQGIVQPESQTRLPPPYFPPSTRFRSTTVPDCLPNITEAVTEEMKGGIEREDIDEAGVIQRITDGSYHSYAAALGVTIGVGCLLLTLNVLIFAGIYYQRDKARRRRRNRQYDARTSPESGTELSQRSPDPGTGAHVIKLHEPPPYYNAVTQCPIIPNTPPTSKKNAPVPPMRNSSIVKKRVSIATHKKQTFVKCPIMTKENKIKVLVLGPVSTGKTSLCNYLGDTGESATGDNRPTKGVRIIEYTADGLSAKNSKTEIELWDCSGDSAYEQSWPALRHDTRGIIFVYSQNTAQQRQVLANMFRYFVESCGFPQRNCLALFNCYGDTEKPEESPLDGVRQAIVHLGAKHHELINILNTFLRNITK